MKRLIIMALVCMFLLSGVVYAETTVSSNIIEDTTWTKAGSPYLITQSIDVYPDVTLTIEPGVEVKFCLGCDLEIYCELIAIGTESKMITFTSDQTTPSAGDWGGIIFKEGAIGTTGDGNGNYVSGSIIKYCKINYGGGLKSKIDLFIANNIIMHNNFSGIFNEGCSNIRNNTIGNNSPASEGGGIYNSGSNSSISGNLVENNSNSEEFSSAKGGGIYNSGANTTINNNTIHNNSLSTCDYLPYDCQGGGIYNSGANTTIKDNEISGNTIVGFANRDLSDVSGGGIYNSANDTIIDGNTITGNSVPVAFSTHGVGICNKETSVTIQYNTVTGNFCDDVSFVYGCGIYSSGDSMITSNTITDNQGGGIYLSNSKDLSVNPSSFTITSNTIIGNDSGIHLKNYYLDISATIDDNTIADNSSCGIWIENNSYAHHTISIIINNNMISGNSQGIGDTFFSGDSAKTISNNIIVDNAGEGISNSGHSTITCNTISGNSSTGISNIGDSTISFNIITGNDGSGICNSGFSFIDNNEITGNFGYGIEASSLNSFTENNLYNNTTYDFYYTGTTDQTATNNYWGTTNTLEIDKKIYDYWDDINLGKVIYEPFAAEPFVPTPDISISLSSYDFGTVNTGNASPAQAFTITNTGDADLVIGTLSIAGANATEFSIVTDYSSGQTLWPSETSTVDIAFSPTSEGVKSANLSIPSNDPDTPTVNVSLNGIGSDISEGCMVTSDLWIRAVINTEEKGDIEAVWKKGGEDTTSRGDRVIWGHFYASPSDVTWGSENNPDLFVKIWFDVSGRVDVNFFHVSVPKIEVYSDYPYDGTVDEYGTTTMSRRYIRQYYQNGESNMDENYEDGNPPPGYSPTGNPFGYSTINDLRIGSIINTDEKGPIDALWRLGGQDTTARGDQVVWGLFYASPSDVTWGSENNPDLFVKIWFDVSGRTDVNFFHVSVPDIEVYSDLPDDGTYDQQGTTIMDNRYIRHEY